MCIRGAPGIPIDLSVCCLDSLAPLTRESSESAVGSLPNSDVLEFYTWGGEMDKSRETF